MGNKKRPLKQANSIGSANNSTLRSMKTSIRFESIDDLLAPDQEQKKSNVIDLLRLDQPHLLELEDIGAKLLSHISDSDFNAKYGRDFSMSSGIQSYLCTQQPRQYTYIFEAFASVVGVPQDSLKRKKEEMIYHNLFEDIIERYTKTRSKPNPILMETRSSEFCYRLTIVIEAVPITVQSSLSFYLSTLRLYRQFEIMYFVWEKYREDFLFKSCYHDQLVGIPMPFEFVSVTGTEYDFAHVKTSIHYFDIRGNYVPVKGTKISSSGMTLGSFLNYMSVEKLGPSLSYMMDLLRSQRRWFSVSTALKILDQILCRLMVLHKYGIILGNMELKFLNFGVREAVNVLYINSFDCALVAPTTNKPLSHYNERFASIGVFRGTSHFVNDIETAFYIFLSLLMPRLPWDDKENNEQRNSSWSIHERSRNTKFHTDERQRLWESPSMLDRLMRAYIINTEDSPALSDFAFDITQMVYMKFKDAISTCAGMPQLEFMATTLTLSTPPHNAFNNIRKVIVSFFRFESLSSNLRDPICLNKVERLLESELQDNRALWDLNNWCWNIFETSFMNSSRKVSGINKTGM